MSETKAEAALFRSLSSPRKIQDFLETLRMRTKCADPIVRSPLAAIRAGEASCIEGALIACTALLRHGQKALLLDLKVSARNHADVDHVVALFQADGRWGAISKTAHSVLRYREPVYASARELAMSYFHEYFTDDGKKTLRSFSAPFDISKHFGEEWIESDEDLLDIACALDDSPHTDILAKGGERKLRLADPIEISAGKLTQ